MIKTITCNAWTAGWLAFAAVACLGGCAEPNARTASNRHSPTGPMPPPKPRRVEMINLTARTDSTNPAAPSLDKFVATATELSSAGKSGRLRRYIARYPEVALEVLRMTSPASAGSPPLQAIAEAYDHLFVSETYGHDSAATGSRVGIDKALKKSPAGWRAALQAMAAHPKTCQADFDARRRMKSFIEEGRRELAMQADPWSAKALPPFLKADALRLTGIALFLDNQPSQAATTWQAALALADADVCVAAELNLLIAEAYRKAERATESVAAFDLAAAQATHCNDPIFWERLLDFKPPQHAWPPEVQACFRPPVLSTPGTSAGEDGFDDGFIWSRVGEWRLARGEASAALLAFTHGDSESRSTPGKGETRIGQARALLSMKQTGSAMAILSSLFQTPDSSVSHHALAVLGVVHLQQGRNKEGLTMLKRAVESADHVRWPDYGLAQTDLALAYLAAGQESEGLQTLHVAQATLLQEGHVADLCQSLANETSYLQKAGRADEASLVLQQIAKLDMSTGQRDMRP